jgi:hypothetical protein
MMARLSAPVIINANRGSVSEISNDSVEARFTSLFQSLDYTEYHDLSDPIIEVSDSSDIGWIAVNTLDHDSQENRRPLATRRERFQPHRMIRGQPVEFCCIAIR